MPESVARSAERKRGAREAARRRQALATLRLVEAVARYAAEQLANGASPEQARAAVIDAAGELSELAVLLRRLVRLGPAERRLLAVQLAAFGVPRTAIAARLGLSERAVRDYLRRPGAGR